MMVFVHQQINIFNVTLDYVMTFSLPKLVFDNELCGQIHHLLRPVAPLEDLPTIDLVKSQLADEHMLTAPHTLDHWPQQLYLPGKIWDRKNDDSWVKAGSKTLLQRATEEVEERLAKYQPLETEAYIDAEMRRIIIDGMTQSRPLPEVPPLPESSPNGASPKRQRRRNRRNR